MCEYACVCADGMRAVQVAVVLKKLLVYAEVLRADEPAGKLETSGRGRGLRSSNGGTLCYTPNIQMYTPNYVMYTPNRAVLQVPRRAAGEEGGEAAGEVDGAVAGGAGNAPEDSTGMSQFNVYIGKQRLLTPQMLAYFDFLMEASMCCYNVEAVQGRNSFEGHMVKNVLLHNTEAAKRELACVLAKCLPDTPAGAEIVGGRGGCRRLVVRWGRHVRGLGWRGEGGRWS